MQNHFPPRRNIDTIISSIRNMANNTCKEVSSNAQDPVPIPQTIESRTSIQSERAQPTASAGTQMAAMLRSIGVANPEIGNLVEGIHKVHAKVDQVIRFISTDKNQMSTHENYQTLNSQQSERNHEVHNQEAAQVRSLNELSFPNVPSLQEFPNTESMSNMASIRNAISNRPITFSHPVQPHYIQQYNMNNGFAINAGAPIPYPFPNEMPMHQSNFNTVNPNEYESTLIKMIPLECDPVPPQYTSHAAQQVPSTGSVQPSNYNLYPNRSLNEVQEPREQVEPDRPKSLLYTSNYTRASQNKPKSQLQYPPASVVHKNKLNLPDKKSNVASIQNLEGNSEASGYFEADQEDYYGLKNGKGPYGSRRGSGLKEVSQNQYVENIMRKIKTQENNYKQMQAGKQTANVKTGLETGGNPQIQNENSYKEDPSIQYGYTHSMNSISERSGQINSIQEIGKKMGQLGKEGAKSKQKRAIPSLGGGNLVYEKKENPLQTNVQVFGKEVRSGKHMGTLMARRTSSGNIRDTESKEFVRKDPNQRKAQPPPEFIKKTGNMKENYSNRHYNEPSYEEEDDYVEEEDYEDEDEEEYEEEEEESYYEEDDEDYDADQRRSERYYGGESERKSRQPGQEEQDVENTELQRSEFIIRDGRSRVENGEMVWSSHKKQRMVGYMH